MSDPASTFNMPGNQQGKEKTGVSDVETFNAH